MKNKDYGGAIRQSLYGRNAPPESEENRISEVRSNTQNVSSNIARPISDNIDPPYGYNKDGSIRKSNAGRKQLDEAEKRVQLTLTIDQKVRNHLSNWSADKPRTISKYLSAYIEDHYQEIIDYFENK